jgi:hypothetical protein
MVSSGEAVIPAQEERAMTGSAVQRAYERGVREFDQHIRTAAQVADLAGLTPHRVRRIARHRGIGREFHGLFLFTPEEADQIINRQDLRKKGATT